MAKTIREVVILGANRTPLGSFNGALSSVHTAKLGAIVIKEAVKRAGISETDVDEVIMGCVLPAGLGQAPARQAALYAGLPDSVETLTINKVCGSGLKSVMLAAQAIALGDADIIVAGGMENMSQAPYLLQKGRTGYSYGHGEVLDSMVKDGLWDVYNNYPMGSAADFCAQEKNISREEQDEYAVQSYKRAQEAQSSGRFSSEITPVEVPMKKGKVVVVSEDEEPQKVIFDKVGKLRPAFTPDGTVTAANASTINDGAAAVVVMAKEIADERGLTAQGQIVSYTSSAKEPQWFTTAPVDAVNKCLKKAELTIDDIDLFEVNEAFSVVALAAQKELSIPMEKLNVDGGAVAIGHPLGASGTRILTTLIHGLEHHDKKVGLAGICIGGGEASSMIIRKI